MNILPDLNRLRVFHVVFTTGSITGAAEKLHLTKSAVSQSIKLLEEELGEKLFLRTGRTLTSTDAARSLFQIVEPFLTTLSEQYGEDAQRGEPVGMIRLSAPPLVGSQLIVPCITAFKKAHPRIRFQVHLTTSIAPLDLLKEDKIDFCIVDSLDIMFGNRSHFLVRDLLTDPEYVACSKNYWQQVFGKKPTYGMLCESEFISYHENAAEIRYWMETTFGRSPRKIDPSLVVDTPDLMLLGIRKDMGLGLIPKAMITKELQKGELVPIGGQKGIYKNIISLVTMKEKDESRAASLFIKFLLDRI